MQFLMVEQLWEMAALQDSFFSFRYSCSIYTAASILRQFEVLLLASIQALLTRWC